MRSHVIVLGVALLVGHGGQPLDAVRTMRGAGNPAPRADEANADAAAFLAAARGADPVICSLAAVPLGGGWGFDGAPPADAHGAADLVAWALKPSIADRDLHLLEAGIRDTDPCVQAMAARLLAASHEGPAILLAALGNDRAETRRAAVEGLGYAEDRRSVAAIIRRLDDVDASVRASAAWALGRIEDPSAESALGDALQDPAPTVRIAAIRALGELELESSIDLLLPMLSDQDPRARVATAHALGELH